MLDRRVFLLSGLSLAACSAQSQADEPAQGLNPDIFEADGVVPWGEETIDYANQPNSWWRERLSADAFRVLRQEGTERPGSSHLNGENRQGLYVCAGCGLPLFTSATKYESGTGWPSFWAPIEGALDTKADYRLWTPRVEYHCARCKGHQGHVFEDGPRPTGQRWCNNGIALSFIPDPRV